MDWRIKGGIQKILGRVPAGEKLHYFLQRHGGGLTNFARECDVKLDDFGLMVGHFHTVGIPVAGSAFLEMGTGWYPMFPLALYLGGAASVDTLDLNRHLKKDRTIALVERLAMHLDRIAEVTGRPRLEVGAAYARLSNAMAHGASVTDATSGVVRYRAPADARATGLASGSIDVVFSNSVLEHVPGDVIAQCFVEARRVLKPGAIVFHSVNCGDHYAYVDRSIDQLHYLQFSDAAWKKWNNRFLYQNRLRAVDFVRMAREAGFAIEIDTSRPHPDRLRRLDAMRIDPSFARYTREELAVTSIDLVGRNPGRAVAVAKVA
jgi:SAM-dependent methyltransferase